MGDGGIGLRRLIAQAKSLAASQSHKNSSFMQDRAGVDSLASGEPTQVREVAVKALTNPGESASAPVVAKVTKSSSSKNRSVLSRLQSVIALLGDKGSMSVKPVPDSMKALILSAVDLATLTAAADAAEPNSSSNTSAASAAGSGLDASAVSTATTDKKTGQGSTLNMFVEGCVRDTLPEDICLKVFEALKLRAPLVFMESLMKSPVETWKTWSFFLRILTELEAGSVVFSGCVDLWKRIGVLGRMSDANIASSLMSEIMLPGLLPLLENSAGKREELCGLIYAWSGPCVGLSEITPSSEQKLVLARLNCLKGLKEGLGAAAEAYFDIVTVL